MIINWINYFNEKLNICPNPFEILFRWWFWRP
jgi:hypothetical protein